MPSFRVTYAAGERTNSTVIEARSQAEAREAFNGARIPGVRLVSVEPDSDTGPATTVCGPVAPQPQLPSAPAVCDRGVEAALSA